MKFKMPSFFYYTILPLLLATFTLLHCGRFKPVDVEVSFDSDKPDSKTDTRLLSEMNPENIGYVLYDLEKKSIVRSHNRSLAFIPASTTKVATTVAALNVLGPEYRLKTYLSCRGSITGGVLKGELYLKGTGDPFLSVSDLMDMADELKKKGITSVSGHFYFDDKELRSSSCIDSGMEPDASANMGVSALSLDNNSIIAEWKQGKKSKMSELYLIPSLPVNRISISGERRRSNVRFYSNDKDGVESWFLSPDEKRHGTERLPVKNPALYTASMLTKICEIRGIRLPGPEPGTMPEGTSTIAVHTGMKLSDIVDLTLTYSINLSAELMMLVTAKSISGTAMKLDESAQVIAKYYSQILSKINWKDFRMVNGSGLTVKNRSTPEQITAILIYADAQSYNGKKYRSFLPASGWKASLFNRLNDPDTAFHVWAKTGSINYALGLAGYLYTKSKKKMAFAVFINDRAEREMYDADPDRRAGKSTQKASSWLTHGKHVMDSLVAGWIKEL